MSKEKSAQKYWRANLKTLVLLLSVWFTCSFGTSIFFKDLLDNIMLGGFPLGFWFAQQGSIYIFVILIFIYVRRMNRLDRSFGFEDDTNSTK
jgi:putative solute:sodium symporter small subunit